MMTDDWERALRERAVTLANYSIVSHEECRNIADSAGVSWREMEIFALEHGICPSRYERSIGTLTMAGQKRLLESSAAVIGCGGLGGLIIELLARSGVGRLTLVDSDVFIDNNLNRQVLCAEADIGRPKATVARERALALNGVIEVKALYRKLNDSNAAEILSDASVVVDALDNNSSRKILLNQCREMGIPFVHSAIGGYWAQVGIFFPGDRSPWDGRDEVPDKGVETEMGNPPFTASFAASLEASLAIRLLAGVPNIEGGVLHWCDMSDMTIMKLKM